MDNWCYNFTINAHCFRRMKSCHTFYTFTWIVMLIKQFVMKNGLNSEVFLRKLFQKNANVSAWNGESAAATTELNKKCWTWNWLCVNALAKWRIKWIKLFFFINELQFYYIMRWQRCNILTPRVINKVHIGPQFEYIISKRFSVSKTLFHSNNPSDCCRTHARERWGSAHHASHKWVELYRTWHLRDCTQNPQPHTKFQAL